MREFSTWRDPYDAGFSTCRPKKIQIQEGLTVLVGCNGAGKSTLLCNIAEELTRKEIPLKFFDNLTDGSTSSVGQFMFNRDYEMAVALSTSSEGEAIQINIGNIAQHLSTFLKTGKYSDGSIGDKLTDILKSLSPDDSIESNSNSSERWLLLDATDSGLSIDNVVELKDLFQLLIEESKRFGVELYIVISANEYELARGEQCFDVNAGKYLTFKDYDDYRKFILKNRQRKQKRIEHSIAKRERKAQQRLDWDTATQRSKASKRELNLKRLTSRSKTSDNSK